MDTHVKERLTGAIILVGVLVLLVPELLTGPKRDASPQHASGDEPPLRSYTIELNDDARGGDRAATPPAITEPAQPQPMGAAPNEAQSAEDIESGEGVAASSEGDEVKAPAGSASEEVADAAPAEPVGAQASNAKPTASESDASQARKPDAAQTEAGSASRTSQPPPDANARDGQASTAARSAKPDARAQGSPPTSANRSQGQAANASRSASTQAGETDAVAASTSRTVQAPSSEASKPANTQGGQAASTRSSSKPASGAGYSIQVGSFKNRSNAERLAGELKGKGFSAFVSEGKSNGRKLFRVRVGPEPDKASAQALGAKLRAAGRAGSLVAEH